MRPQLCYPILLIHVKNYRNLLTVQNVVLVLSLVLSFVPPFAPDLFQQTVPPFSPSICAIAKTHEQIRRRLHVVRALARAAKGLPSAFMTISTRAKPALYSSDTLTELFILEETSS
jgi:hypothetical protein